ncbi:hypothetical protein VNI00_004200 [Paramarasmius palmivorus]|uniref:Uncharacterized protein n=1 Tax=Paramarasmius palmivorus TaxID=297713 RepID=A0AAW0DPI7_9AGAR
MNSNRVLIIGGGSAGFLTAQVLKKLGIPYTIFERDGVLDPRRRDWDFGIYWAQTPLASCLPPEITEERVTVTQVDDLTPSADDTCPIYDASTGETMIVLPTPFAMRLQRRKFVNLISEGLDVKYGKRLVGVETNGKIVTATFEDGTKEQGGLLIGADGAHSKVRDFLLGPEKSALKRNPLVLTYVTTTLPEEAIAQVRKLHNRMSVAFHPAGIFTFFGDRGQGLNNAILDVASLQAALREHYKPGDTESFKRALELYEPDVWKRGREAVILSDENSEEVHNWDKLKQSSLFKHGAKQRQAHSSTFLVGKTCPTKDTKKGRIDKLKEEGNKLFANKDFKAAIAKYTEGITLDDKNAVLYANRAACKLSIKQYLDAASDASLATEIDPRYAKAWARLATAQDMAFIQALKQPVGSVYSWRKAVDALSKGGLTEAEKKQKAEYEASLARAKKDEAYFWDTNKPFDYEKMSAFARTPLSHKLSWEIATEMIPQLIREGNCKSSAWTIAFAYNRFEEANRWIMQNSIQGTFAMVKLQCIEKLTNAIITDMRVFHVSDPKWFEKFEHQMYLEAQSRQAWTHAAPEKIKKEALQRLAKESSWVVFGFLDGGMRHNWTSEAQYIGRAIEIIKWGRRVWADVAHEDRGVIFRETFLRGVQTLHMEAVIKLYSAETNRKRKKELLEELLAEADEVIKSVESEAPPPYATDPAFFIGHYDYPRGQGYAMKGFYYNELAKKTTDKTEKTELCRKSGFLYLDAAEIFPEDDERHAHFLHVAIKNMMEVATPVTFILTLMERLRNAVPKMLKIWTISPLATANRDESIRSTLSWEAHLRKKLAEGKVSEEYGASFSSVESPHPPSAFKVDMDFK